MADTLEIFGVEYTNVAGIIAKDDNGVDQTYTKGGGHLTQDQDGFLVIPPDGSGGGGSSDFSTATVTIVSNVGGIVYLPATMDEGGMSGLLCYGLTDAGDYDIVLYKEMCVGSVTTDEQNTVTTTGDIVNNSGILLVTGDGTITIS